MRAFFLVFLLLCVMASSGQNKYGQTDIFTVESEGESIDFLRISADPSKRKPVIVFCVGSFPAPLLIKDDDKTIIPYVRYFIYDGLWDDYNFVVIGKPNIPAVAKKEELSPQYTVVTDLDDPFSFRPEFSQNNYLEKHVDHTVAVLKYLKGQEWVDGSRIILMGHSQGAHVAAYTAYEYPDIAAVGYFGGNPMGRFSQFLTEERNKAFKGEVTMEEAQASIETFYAKWTVICRGMKKDNNGDPDHTWKSFSNVYIDKLVALKTPLFVAYGTSDPGGHLCYLLPVYFELAGKTDYEMKAFVGRGHNFETFDADGKPDMNDSKWFEAMRAFVEWSEDLPR